MNFFLSFKEYLDIFKTLISPKEVYSAVEEIDLDSLYRQGYRTIFLDVDNTLLTYSETEISFQKITWIEKVKLAGYKVFIISNNSSCRRIKKVSEQMGVFGLYFAMKPMVLGIKELASDWEVDLTKSLVIGDQLLTDIIFGNWVKAHTVLVDPLDKNVSFLRALQREVEMFLLKKLEIV
jgi:uncharacterized protein